MQCVCHHFCLFNIVIDAMALWFQDSNLKSYRVHLTHFEEHRSLHDRVSVRNLSKAKDYLIDLILNFQQIQHLPKKTMNFDPIWSLYFAFREKLSKIYSYEKDAVFYIWLIILLNELVMIMINHYYYYYYFPFAYHELCQSI